MNALLLVLCVVIGADDFEWSVTDGPAFSWSVTERGGDPIVVTPHEAVSGADGNDSRLKAAPDSTTVCLCQGYKEHLCLCLKAGVPCRCSRTVGSVWAVNEQGRATHKTGAKADPRSASPGAGLTPKPPAASFVPTLRTDGKWWWDDGSLRWSTSTEPTEGREYNGGTKVFVFRGGKMVEKGSQMAVDIAPKSSGHWERRCFGGYCRMVWVPE